jgi:hypothetical protein
MWFMEAECDGAKPLDKQLQSIETKTVAETTLCVPLDYTRHSSHAERWL